jgi:hypothetical protein
MVLNSEKKLLKFINYDLFIRDKLIVDRVGLYLESIRPLIDTKDFEKFSEYIIFTLDLVLIFPILSLKI